MKSENACFQSDDERVIGALRSTGQQWWSTVTRFTLPHLGRLPVCEVTSADVLHPNT